jgi:heat shock protein HtpX
MKRVGLFILTNLAIVAVLFIVASLLGVDRYLDEHGAINFEALLIFSFILGMGGSFISLAISKWSAKRMTGAKVIEQPRNETEIWLLRVVENQARQAGIKMPEVAIYPGEEMNAFATGMNKNKALVAVSVGLLRNMSRDEVEAVLGHEISHVANGDMVTLALVQGVVNTFVIFFSRIIGHFVDRVILKNDSGHGIGFFVTTIVAQMVLGILASTIVFWFSRYREFRADEGGARLAGKDKMVSALRRLGGNKESEMPEKMAAFGIFGKPGQGIKRLFMTHPPLEERIESLQRKPI